MNLNARIPFRASDDKIKIIIEYNKILLENEKLKLEKEKFAHSRWWKEDDLVNNRLSWLLRSQVILFATYGIIYKFSDQNGFIHNFFVFFKKEHCDQLNRIINSIPYISFFICIFITIGICAAWEAQEKLFKFYKKEGINLGVDRVTSKGGKFSGITLPIIFIGGWGYLYRGINGLYFCYLISFLILLITRIFIKKYTYFEKNRE